MSPRTLGSRNHSRCTRAPHHKTKRAPECECDDLQCAHHRHVSTCADPGIVFMFRVGREDDEPRLMCESCADEAEDAGEWVSENTLANMAEELSERERG